MGSLCPKYKMHELKVYRRVMCNDTEESWKIWRRIDLSFPNWHKKFDKWIFDNLTIMNFSLKHLSLKNLMGCFWPNYIMFELKKYRKVIFHDTREWCKTWRKTVLWSGKWAEKKKVSKLGLLLGPFIQSRKCMSLRFTGELCVMKMKNDSKFEKELTSQFKTGMRNLINFSTKHSKILKSCILMGCFWPKLELRKYSWKWHKEFGNFSLEL